MASVRERQSPTGISTYAVLYRHGGKQASRTFVTAKAAADFKTLIDLLGAERALATLGAEDRAGLTVDQLFEKFIAWKARDGVNERTVADYRRDYENWIKKPLGHRSADSIDERDVQTLVDHMAGLLDPKTVRDRHAVLSGMYRYGAAKTRRLVEHNPCQETQLPKRKKKAAKGVTIPEWQALYEAALRTNPDAADLLLFIVTTGWRWSEATPLNVGAVEDYDGLEVYASVRRVVRRDGDMRFVIAEDDAKSAAGMRRLKVTPACAAMLRRRVVGKGPADLVFTNPQGRRWHQTNFLSRTWTKLLEEAGIERRITPHMLRHTQVALLDRSGATLAEIKRRIGHEDIQTTINVYGGMIDEVSDDTLAGVDSLLTTTRDAGEIVEGSVVLELD